MTKFRNKEGKLLEYRNINQKFNLNYGLLQQPRLIQTLQVNQLVIEINSNYDEMESRAISERLQT